MERKKLTRAWGSRTEIERKRRIDIAVAAYAYEIMDVSVMSDREFDRQCLLVDLSIDTGRPKLDKFFRKHFDPSTGAWIHKHPHPNKLRKLVLFKQGKLRELR